MTRSIAPTLEARSSASIPAAGHSPAPSAAGAADATDQRDADRQRERLNRYANWLLGDRGMAEQVVQATLRDMLDGPRASSGRAAARDAAIGILKHKVADALRRLPARAPLHDDSDEDAAMSQASFAPDGHWCKAPSDWGDPERALAAPGFSATLEACIDSLPKNTARVFALREILGMNTGEICRSVSIDRETCLAMLRRARLALHARLEQDWFRSQRVQ